MSGIIEKFTNLDICQKCGYHNRLGLEVTHIPKGFRWRIGFFKVYKEFCIEHLLISCENCGAKYMMETLADKNKREAIEKGEV